MVAALKIGDTVVLGYDTMRYIERVVGVNEECVITEPCIGGEKTLFAVGSDIGFKHGVRSDTPFRIERFADDEEVEFYDERNRSILLRYQVEDILGSVHNCSDHVLTSILNAYWCAIREENDDQS